MDPLKRAWMPLLLVAALLLGCGEPDQNSVSPTAATDSGEAEREEQGAIRLDVSFAPWGPEAAKVAAPQAIDGATVYVYTSDGAELIRQELTLSDGRATGELTVRAAENLRVVLVFYDGEVVRYIGVDDDVDVTIGGETTAELLCHYLGTWVRAPEIAGVNRPYTVSWASRPHATGYELQEAATSDFSAATTVYEGTGLFLQVAGKPDVGGTYFYRARAGTGYGVGPWHSTGVAAVVIHKPEGRIVIDVVIPPDEAHAPPPTEYYSDDFNDNVVDPQKWTTWKSSDAVGWVKESEGQLQIWVSPENTSSEYRFDATSTWLLHGDFDIQVDYHLVDWPADNGIRIGLKAGGATPYGYLDSFGRIHHREWGDVYLSHFSDGLKGIEQTAHMSGTLRLARTGDRISGYYHDGTAWVLNHEGPAAMGDGPVLLGVWGHEATTGGLVAFDNFRINSATVVKPEQPPVPLERR